MEGLAQRHADPALERQLPDAIRGILLTTVSFTPDEFINAGNEAQFTALLERVDRTRDDLSLAMAFDLTGSVSAQVRALRVAGADGDDLLAAVLADDWYSAADVSHLGVGGIAVTVVTLKVEGIDVTEYFYVAGDVIIVVSDAEAELAALVLEALP